MLVVRDWGAERRLALMATLLLLGGCGGAGASYPSTSVSAGPDGDTAGDFIPSASVLPASDSFGEPSLDHSWTVLHGDAVTITSGGGHLSVMLTKNVLWSDDSEGVQIFKPVLGDFVATTTVSVRSSADPAKPPAGQIRLGGLQARDPNSRMGGHENYVHIVAGSLDSGPGLEHKSTVESHSFAGSTSGPVDVQLRICRVGPDISLLWRESAASAWSLAHRYHRPDLPSSVDVGPSIYVSAPPPPDLTATYAGVDFSAVSSGPADCTAG